MLAAIGTCCLHCKLESLGINEKNFTVTGALDGFYANRSLAGIQLAEGDARCAAYTVLPEPMWTSSKQTEFGGTTVDDDGIVLCWVITSHEGFLNESVLEPTYFPCSCDCQFPVG